VVLLIRRRFEDGLRGYTENFLSVSAQCHQW